MNIGAYIELILKEEKKTKQWLYNELRNKFYFQEKKFISYNGFCVKLTNDTLKAKELLEIADILNINLNQLKRYLSNDISNDSFNNSIPSKYSHIIFTNTIANNYLNFKSSPIESSGLIYNIIETNNNIFVFLFFSKIHNIAFLEEFNFNKNTFSTICIINKLNLYLNEKDLYFEKLINLSAQEKANLLYIESRQYSCIFPNHKFPEKNLNLFF